MRDFVIITDAGCDLSKEMVEALGVKVAPMSLTMENKLYKHYHDYRELSEADFYNKIRNGIVGTTAGTNIQDAMDVMQEVLSQNKDILYIPFSSALSCSYQSAFLAAEELREEYPEAMINVVDSLSASVGLGMLVYLAAKKQMEGCSLKEVTQFVEDSKTHIFHSFMVDDLMYLQKTGRISHLTAVAGTMLNIKPVFKIDDSGKVANDGKVRGKNAGVKHLLNRLSEKCNDANTVFIGHVDAAEDAENLKNKVLEIHPKANVIVNCLGPILGNSLGPNALVIIFYGDNR